MIILFMAGCASNQPVSLLNDKFLSDYSRLTPQESLSGAAIWQWKSPEFSMKQYAGITVEKIVFSPSPDTQDQASAEALESIRQSVQQVLDHQLNLQSGENDLVLRSAITSVSLETKPLSIREAIPVKLVFSGAELLLGKRDKNFSLRFEYQLIDTASGEVLMSGVRESSGKPLVNENDQLSNAHAKPIFENLIQDLALAGSVLRSDITKP